jgi:hypothetical protein
MNIKELNEKLRKINDEYNDVVLKKIQLESEFSTIKSEYSKKIINCNEKTVDLRLEKRKLLIEFKKGKRSPEEVKRLRRQFNQKKEKLMENKDKSCEYCGDRKKELTIHHRISLLEGGENTEDNLVWACKDCHDEEEGRVKKQ